MLLYIINSILRFSFRVNIICKLSENSEELASQFVRAGSMDIYHFVLNDENENLQMQSINFLWTELSLQLSCCNLLHDRHKQE